MSGQQPLGLFQGFGIELEYMIVQRDGLDVLPVSDQLLKAVAGSYVSETEQGALAWSNELVLHVIELKTNGPASTLAGLGETFVADLRRIDELLEPMGGRLLPSAMHPWMDPHRESRLWPHQHSPIYESYDRIFGCQGHGWSNLQSMHINLPFAGDGEFARLHTAIRLLLPLMPALAASSPFAEGRLSGFLDTRLETYRGNASRIPSITGAVVPESVSSAAEYHRRILQPMYRDISPHDPAGILQEEWLNSRGAIARFDRDAIEIRVLDIQECPRADLAVAAAIVAVLKALVCERWCELEAQQALPTECLATMFLDSVRRAEQAQFSDPGYLTCLGASPRESLSAADLWRHLLEQLPMGEQALTEDWDEAVRIILEQGCLARRIVAAAGPDPQRGRLAAVYRALADCLLENQQFQGLSW
jgi:gamma-glutamyl:cysteine ligase YbdK (ATP-grasp superfamily)